MNNTVGISRFESVMFKLTRFMAATVAAIAVIAIGICTLWLMGAFDASTKVGFSDVVDAIHESSKAQTTAGTNDGATRSRPYTLPPNVATNINKENRAVLDGWLEGLERAQQQDFLNNLSKVIDQAESDRRNVHEVVNAYKTLKLAKLGKSSRTEVLVERATALTAILLLVLLVVIVSVVLVLLAVERHLRIALQPSPAQTAA